MALSQRRMRSMASRHEANVIFGDCSAGVDTGGCAFVREARSFLAAIATEEPVRRAGAGIKLLSAGDLSAALATTHPESDIDMLIGIGGAHQGVLAAAAIRSAGGDMQCRLKPRNEQEAEQCLAAGILDLNRRYTLAQAGD